MIAYDPPPTQVAANIQQDNVQLEILKLLKDICTDLKSSKKQTGFIFQSNKPLQCIYVHLFIPFVA